VSPVRYELCCYIPEDDILDMCQLITHSASRRRLLGRQDCAGSKGGASLLSRFRKFHYYVRVWFRLRERQEQIFDILTYAEEQY
jgi:hypothetical protein